MTWTKRNTLICDDCGLFCSPETADSHTPFGCKSYDPPEPLDERHTCKKCFKKSYKRWIKVLSSSRKYGDWMKSRAELKAAKKLGLEWVHSNGIGTLGTKDWAEPYQYIDKKEYKRLKKLPYYREK